MLTAKGLKPSYADLDNLFDNSSDEQDMVRQIVFTKHRSYFNYVFLIVLQAADAAPTPPNSNKPADIPGEDDDVKPSLTSGKVSSNSMNGKKMSQIDHASAFANDQLSKMFPTPPSIENHLHASPEDPNAEHESQAVVPVSVKGEPSSVLSETKLLEGLEAMDWTTSPAEESMAVMLASSLFAPLEGLYSDRLPTLTTETYLYQARSKNRQRSLQSQPHSGSNQSHSVPTPLSTPGGQHKSTGASPIPSPRSNQGPGSNYGHDVASPASAYAFNKSSTPSTSKSGQATCSGDGLSDYSKAPEANSLLLNLMLSDTLMNVFRDHNFDSCTLCVCTNEGNIRGRDATIYLPPSELANAGESGDSNSDDVNCSCGFSAVTNRRLAHQSGLFYEDETEVTGITEDLYYRKKASLLLLDPKGHHEDSGSNDNFAEKSTEVDTIPSPLMDLIIKQSTFYMSSHNALYKYSHQYLRTAVQPTSISMVELVDGNDVIFSTLEQVKTVTTPCGEGKDSVHQQQIQSAKLDLAQKGTCLHKWALLPAPGPMCSEDIIRVMKSLQPVLNTALHSSGGISTSLRKQPPTPVSGDKSMTDKSGPTESKKAASAVSSNLSVEGPLTWRQFHRMAGPATKGNTDDQCEPLPVPSVTLGHERDFLSISPLALHFWDSLGMEPFSTPRDVVYIVVAPDNEFLVGKVKRFFKNLSNVYEVSLDFARIINESTLILMNYCRCVASENMCLMERW